VAIGRMNMEDRASTKSKIGFLNSIA